MQTIANPLIEQLGPYPMQRLAALADSVTPPSDKPLIRFSVGEPKHALPQVIVDALAAAAGSVNSYPTNLGTDALRGAITDWLQTRFAPARIDAATQVLPVNGVREGLFSFVQAIVDPTRAGSYVVCPNPGYAVYDGVTVLSGLTPYHLATRSDGSIGATYAAIPSEVWRSTQLVFVCSPDNPRGSTLALDDWRTLFALADEHGFVIVSDECYCEIYVDEGDPPLGALQAATELGRGYDRLAAFFSLSKRSNAPGLRSGFIAGDAALLRRTETYRSYNGGGMNQAVQAASVAAWRDEAHVVTNRALYRQKYEQVIPLLQQVLPVPRPRAGFFLWADVRGTGLSDETFTRELLRSEGVLVLPGTYLTHASNGVDPGEGHVRIALVANLAECMEGAQRIARFCRTLVPQERAA